MTTSGSEHRRHWGLDPVVLFLNHGSFGACPREVLSVQTALRAEMEAEPVRFLARELEGRLDQARAALATFLGASPDDLAFVTNASSGVNTVLRSLRFEVGDELLVTDQEYNASRNALEYVAGLSGARLVVVPVPFPLASAGQVVDAIAARITDRTRLLLIDHVTSPTGIVNPIERIVRVAAERQVDVLVDGAHAPGMCELELDRLAAAYYTGNCHKWLCAPKGAAFLHVRRDRQDRVVPLVVSHGWNDARADRTRFRRLFDWTGTDDPTPWLCVPEAIRVMASLVPGGWPELRARNRSLALEARDLLCRARGVAPPAPDDMIGSLAAVPLPDGAQGDGSPSVLAPDPLQGRLFDRHRIEVPIVSWPAPPHRLVRVSAQLYNTRSQYEALAAALAVELGG